MNRPGPAFAPRLTRAALALGLAGLLAACGGGGGGGSDGHATIQAERDPDATIAGAVVKGPLETGQVCAWTLADPVTGELGAKRGCASTDANGQYRIFVLSVNPAGETLVVAATKQTGYYQDEATGTRLALDATLRSAVRLHPGDAATTMVTPLTELAVRRAQTATGGLSETAVDLAMELVARAFDTGDLRQTLPADPTRAAAVQAPRGARNYGLALAGVSSLRADLTPPPGGRVTVDDALAELELAFRPDRVEGQATKFKAALHGFLSGPRNASGVTPAAMASALSLELGMLPQAVGVLPAIQPLGPDLVAPLPVEPTDGPACRVTVSQPAAGGLFLFPLEPYTFCVRKVEPAQCQVGTMQGVLRGDKLYNVLQGPTFGMTDHAVQVLDSCEGSGAQTTLDLG